MKSLSRLASFSAFMLVVGCVVIPDTFDANINVTIRHIQEQAEDFLDYVEGKTDTLEVDPSASENVSMLRKAWNFVSPIQTAYAAETKMASPRVQQIGNKMKERNADVKAIKKTGAVGESNRGLLELVAPEKAGDADKKNEVQRVIAAENDDRKALYKEIVRLNSDTNMTVTQVENIYAAEYRERANSGELIQLPNGGKEFEDVKASGLGKALGGKCQPGAWVEKP